MPKIINKWLADMPSNTLKGNDAGSSDSPRNLTVSEVLDMLGITSTADLVEREEWGQNGFPDISQFSITWDDATRTLSIGTGFDYYIVGVKYTETGDLTKQIADETGNWVFYLDSEGVIEAVKNPGHTDIDAVISSKCIIAYVYWNSSLSDGRLMLEYHGMSMSPATHHWLHDNIGSVYKYGMALEDFSDVNGDGDDDPDAQFGVASGAFYDEDIEHNLSAIASTVGLEIWYLNGTDWEWATNSGFSVLNYSGGDGLLAYNDAGTQVEVDNLDFVLCHIFATNICADNGTGPRFIAIQGQDEYNTTRLARTGAEEEINNLVFGTFPLQEIVPVATVIFQTRTGYDNAVKARIVTTDSGDNYIDWRGSGIKATGGSISDHGALAGLADDDHPQYLKEDGTRPLSGPLSMGSNKLTDVSDGVDPNDAVNKSQLDAVSGGGGDSVYVEVYMEPQMETPSTITRDPEDATIPEMVMEYDDDGDLDIVMIIGE